MNTQSNTMINNPTIEFGQSVGLLRDVYKNVSARQLYHYLINIDEYYDILPTALNFIKNKLHAAEISENDTIVPFFDYTSKSFSMFVAQLTEKKLAEEKKLEFDIKNI